MQHNGTECATLMSIMRVHAWKSPYKLITQDVPACRFHHEVLLFIGPTLGCIPGSSVCRFLAHFSKPSCDLVVRAR